MRLYQPLIHGHFDPRLQLEAEPLACRTVAGLPLFGVPGIQDEIYQAIAAIDGLAERLRQSPRPTHGLS